MRKLWAFLRRNRFDADLEEEMNLHVELRTQQQIEAGTSPDEASHAARRRFGNAQLLRDASRDVWGWQWLGALRQDVRYGRRMLTRNPSVTVVVLLSLALGIGANTAIFSLLNALVLKSLPVQHPEQLVQFSETYPEGNDNSNMSFPEFVRIRDRSQTLSSVFAFTELGRANVGFNGKAELAKGQLATGAYFSTLGLKPAAGRFFNEEDDQGRVPVAVISYGFWQRAFGGDSSVLGKTITWNGVPFTLIGVTPAPFLGLEVGGESPDITAPMTALERLSPTPPDWDGAFDSWLEIMGRLKPGVTTQQAQAEFAVIYHQLLNDLAPTVKADQRQFMARVLRGAHLNVQPGKTGFESGLRHEFSSPLRMLMIVVGIVLLIACANVANLLLARAEVRRKEIAMRLAIGASRARLIRQLLTESVLLSALGGMLGLALAWWGSGILLRIVSTGDSVAPVDLSPDLRVLLFTAGVSILTGILFGLAPALRLTRVDFNPALQQGRQTAPGRRRIFALDKVLVIAQVALSLVLLVGAGLFVHSLQKLWAIDPGYDRNNVLMFSVDPRQAGYKDSAKLAGIYRQLLSGIRELPEVRSASLSLVRPVDAEAYWVNAIESVNGHKLPEGQRIRVAVNSLGPDYFANMGTPMLLGREFDARDNEASPKVAVISEMLARQCFGKANPIGQRIAKHESDDVEVVGVVKESRYGRLRDVPRSVLYLPFFQGDLAGVYFSTTFEARYSGGLSTVLDGVRRQVSAAGRSLPLFRVKTLKVETEDSLVKEHLIAMLATFFGLLAVLLACVGLYATMAYRVTRRTGEIGVRMALGARQREVLWMVLRETVLLIAVGIAIGLSGALAASTMLTSQLYGVKPTDIPTIAAATLLLTAVAVLAGYVPARRASRVDPMVALRHE